MDSWEERELLRLTRIAEPSDIGYKSRLLDLWNSKYPDLKTTSTALYQRLSVVRNRGVGADEQVVQLDHTQVVQMEVTDQVRMQKVRMYEFMCAPLQIPAGTRTKFESQWMIVRQTGLSDFTARTKFTCKEYTMDHQDIDQLMVGKWESSEKSLWAINQILYTGASTVYKSSQKDQKKKGDKQSRLDIPLLLLGGRDPTCPLEEFIR